MRDARFGKIQQSKIAKCALISASLAMTISPNMALASPVGHMDYQGKSASPLADMMTPGSNDSSELRRYGHRRHHRGVDAGDVIAGVLVLGGIAAIASAANNNSRKQREEYERERERYEQQRRDEAWRQQQNQQQGYNEGYQAPYGNEQNYGQGYNQQGYGQNDLNSAVQYCSEAARAQSGNGSAVQVRSVTRNGNGWRVEGTTTGQYGGQGFSCGTSNGQIDFLQMD